MVTSRFAGLVFLICAVVAAIVIHQHTHMEPCGLGVSKPECAVGDPWQNPLAVAIGVTGVLIAGSLFYLTRRVEPS